MANRTNHIGLKRTAGPGRPKGSQNKITKAAKDLAAAIVGDPEYLAQLKRRVMAGTAGQMELLLWHYQHGKPKEQMELSGSVETPTQVIIELHRPD